MVGKHKRLHETDHMFIDKRQQQKNPQNTEGRSVSIYFYLKIDGL